MDDQLTTLWNDVLSEVKKRVSTGNFVMFFKSTALLSRDDNIATIATPSLMVADLLQKRFKGDIKQLLDAHTKTDNEIVFIVKTVAKSEKDDESPLFAEAKEEAKPEPTTATKSQPLAVGHLPRVRPEYTFATFAVSSSNQLAFTAASTVAKHIGTFYNPLFLYGPVGVGKTHLMHAVANSVYQQAPDKKIIYITSEEFTNEVVEAIRTNSTAQMKKKFRSAILLIIDDIQFIEGKEKVQEELFHTFNILIDNHAQICLSSDRPPHEIKKLEKRLSSRFAGGLTVDIEKPDVELKTAILKMKAEKFGYTLPIDVATLLAEQVEDTRSLEGLLLRVITQANASGGEISLDLAQRSLGIIKEERTSHIHADDVIKCVCDFYGVKSTQLKGPKRDAGLVKARQITMYLLKDQLGLTYVEIGNLLGGRDHTTIMHGVEKIEGLVENKAKIVNDIVGITKAILG
jgi:chromosomal replication initiator protein